MSAKGSITLQEAADRLGVHYMTAYRYVRTGRLAATKDGGEWRVAPKDLAALRTDRDAAASPGRRRRRDYASRLENRLIAGDEAGAWSIIEGAMASGVEPDEVYLEVLAPALESVGDGWEDGRVSVAEEHQASAVALRLIGRLGPRFARRGRKRGSIVLGAPPSDHHGVPVALLTDLLRGRGFRVYDLGDDVPTDSFVETAHAADRLLAVGLSCTSPGNDRRVAQTVRTLKREVGVPVVVGGSAIADQDHADRLGADAWASKAPGALEVFEALADGRPLNGADQG